MSIRQCESCARTVAPVEILCESCAAAQGRCAVCGAAGVYRAGTCPHCDPPAPAVASSPDEGEAQAGDPGVDVLEKVRPQERDHGFSLTWILCGICVLIFLASTTIGETTSWEPYEKIGYFSPERIWKGAYWALITSAFVHLDFVHLALNLYWLWGLGHAFERSYGSARWLLFFVTSAWVSSGIQMLTGDTGIGGSGVVYALFGFGWVVREHNEEFRRMIDDQVVRTFVVWFFFCIVITVIGVMAIGNGAHLGGLLFGVMTARLTLYRPRPRWAAVGLAGITALSVLPLFWCPWSGEWTTIQGMRAQKEGRFLEAAGWYRRSLKLGEDPTWTWHTLAEIYGYLQLKDEYTEALRNLRQLSPEKATEVEADYGPSAPSAAGSTRRQ